MRLWSLHPSLLDRQGLVAGWREALLAQAVLNGRTRGYTRHPQLQRFRESADPAGAVADYLQGLYEEAVVRGYRFDASRISVQDTTTGTAGNRTLTVTTGQLQFEWEHLQRKLAVRSPERHRTGPVPDPVPVHPLFRVVPGPVADWERP